jgi:hypothetical protein
MRQRQRDTMASMKRGSIVRYRHGSTVRVKLFDGRTVEAKVCYMEDTVDGRKVTIIHDNVVNRVDAEQIVKVMKS